LTSQTQPHVRLARTFPVPPHHLYRAWLDTNLVRRWMAPGGQEVTRVEIEEPPGGACWTWKADGGVIVGGFDSELLDLVPDRRLVFRWGFIGAQRRQGPSLDTLLTVSFDPEPSGDTVAAEIFAGLAGPGRRRQGAADRRAAATKRSGSPGCCSASSARTGPRHFPPDLARVNGQPGAAGYDPAGRVFTVFELEVADGVIQAIRAVVNPDRGQ
jgi:uncharacterized protein YndB with AHSA1/START domain